MRTMQNYSLRNLTLVLLFLVAGGSTVTYGAPVQYAITQNSYNWNDDLNARVKEEFGPGATVADWTEIKANYGDSVDHIKSFCDTIGLLLGKNAWVTVNGVGLWPDDPSRHYYVERHNSEPPENPNFLVHDYIQNHYLDLGSWWGTKRILVKLPALMVLDPNGGEKLVAGSKYTITWENFADPNINYVLIEYSTNSGQTWDDVDIWWNTGSYQWDPIPTVDSNQCLIRISDLFDPNVSDTSDDVFTTFQCVNPIQGDLNGDCYVDFRDFAIVAEQWLKCGNPFDPVCQP